MLANWDQSGPFLDPPLQTLKLEQLIGGGSIGHELRVAVALGLQTALEIVDALDKYYPSHAWLVRVQHAQGICTIQNTTLDPTGRWNMIGHLNNVRALRGLASANLRLGV